jgi:hypothetical protein
MTAIKEYGVGKDGAVVKIIENTLTLRYPQAG